MLLHLADSSAYHIKAVFSSLSLSPSQLPISCQGSQWKGLRYREIEVCKPLHHRRRRSPHSFLDHHHGHPYHECEKEKKEVTGRERFDLKLGHHTGVQSGAHCGREEWWDRCLPHWAREGFLLKFITKYWKSQCSTTYKCMYLKRCARTRR